MEVEATTEADMFDVALEKVAKGHRGTTGGGITTSSAPNGPGRPGFGKAGPGLSKFSRI